MREYLRPQATALREAKERGESYAAIKKRLAEPLTNAAATPYGCNQYGHNPGCPHAGGGVDPDLEAALRRARREDGSIARDAGGSAGAAGAVKKLPAVRVQRVAGS